NISFFAADILSFTNNIFYIYLSNVIKVPYYPLLIIKLKLTVYFQNLCFNDSRLKIGVIKLKKKKQIGINPNDPICFNILNIFMNNTPNVLGSFTTFSRKRNVVIIRHFCRTLYKIGSFTFRHFIKFCRDNDGRKLNIRSEE